MSLASEIKEIFHDAGVHSTTIQPEFSEVRQIVFLLSRKTKYSVAGYINKNTVDARYFEPYGTR